MLPKFANGLFSHFPRAANTFRQGFFNPSQGPSAGGAKYNAGSRYYNTHGYAQAGRAVTQANTVAGAHDDEKDIRLQRLSLNPRSATNFQTPGRLPHPRFNRTRRYSTSTATAAEVEKEKGSSSLTSSSSAQQLPTPPPSVSQTRPSTPTPPPSSLDPATPQTVNEPNFAQTPVGVDAIDKIDLSAPGVQRIQDALASNRYSRVVQEVKRYHESVPTEQLTIDGFNLALKALISTREGGSSINYVLETYNLMLTKSIIPNRLTYQLLIDVLCARDFEIHRLSHGIGLRMTRRDLIGIHDGNSKAELLDNQRLADLKRENPFNSALLIFQAMASTNGGRLLPQSAYCSLLASCAIHRNIDVALRVFAHFEKNQVPGAQVNVMIYYHLISVYAACKDSEGALEIFEEFKTASTQNRVKWSLVSDSQIVDTESKRLLPGALGPHMDAKMMQSAIWTEMITAYFKADKQAEAIAILEQMLVTPRGSQFSFSDAPLPSAATYTAVLTGFFRSGDLETAIKWFDRLVEQKDGVDYYYKILEKPVRPSDSMWTMAIDTLARAGPKYINDLNRLWLIRLSLQETDNLRPHGQTRIVVWRANMTYLEGEVDLAERKRILDFLNESVISYCQPGDETGIALLTHSANQVITSIIEQMLKIGEEEPAYIDRAISTAIEFAKLTQVAAEQSESRQHSEVLSPNQYAIYSRLVSLLLVARGSTVISGPPQLTLEQVLDFVGALISLSYRFNRFTGPYVARHYVAGRKDGIPKLSPSQWASLCHVVGSMNFHKGFVGHLDPTNFPPLAEPDYYVDPKDLFKDLQANGMQSEHLELQAIRHLIAGLISAYGTVDAHEFMLSLGPGYAIFAESMMEQMGSGVVTPPESTSIPNQETPIIQATKLNPTGEAIMIDEEASKYIDQYYPLSRAVDHKVGYGRLRKCISEGRWPKAAVVGRLINVLGRQKDFEAVRYLYDVAQTVLAAMANDPEQQSLAWFQVEDHMVIANAHGGDLDAAHMHRERILRQGGSPSPDAYGALISGIRDTTDDVSSALQLWTESQERGVRPNLFLYNTIISRLAKARKAEQALELFHQMKEAGVIPSTVTYGAVITACCRVGDVSSSEKLFEEMRASKRYQPRIPPFNTIMQLFTTTKPDRSKVEFYYNLMQRESVAPSDHTYKLLLDAYGSNQPVDLESMWSIFKQLLNDSRVKVNGTHWASVLIACGSVQKDLAKAQEIFEQCQAHPKSKAAALPDAIVYEAMFNVLVANHRSDMFEEYLKRMHQQGTHMTAYIANILIKGYADSGNIADARSMFESLSDPPVGVAASDNHAQHDAANAKSVPTQAPVYREPSTWEAMVRAELGSGHRQFALALIQRMQYRGYPAAVLQRVSGIVHEEVYEFQPSPVSQSPFTIGSPFSDQSTFGSATPPSSLY